MAVAGVHDRSTQPLNKTGSAGRARHAQQQDSAPRGASGDNFLADKRKTTTAPAANRLAGASCKQGDGPKLLRRKKSLGAAGGAACARKIWAALQAPGLELARHSARHHASWRFRSIVPGPPSPSPRRRGLFFGHWPWQLVRYIGDARPRLSAPCRRRFSVDFLSGRSGVLF